MKDRRQFFRIRTIVPLVLKIPGYDSPVNGFSRDISASGLKLELPLHQSVSDILKPDKPMEIELVFPFKKEKYNLPVVLVWVENRKEKEWFPLEAGVQFSGLKPSLGRQIFLFALRKFFQPYFLMFTLLAFLCFIWLLLSELNQYKLANQNLSAISENQAVSFDTLRQQSEFLRLSYAGTLKQYEYLTEKIPLLEQQQSQLIDELKAKEKVIAELESQKNKMTGDLSLLQQEIQQKSSMSTADSEAISRLETELQALKSKSASILEDKWNLEKQIAEMSSQQKSTASRLENMKQSTRDHFTSIYKPEIGEKEVCHITLKNGYGFTGIVVSDDDVCLELRVAQGVLSIMKSDIKVKQTLNIKDYSVLITIWQTELSRYEKIASLPVAFESHLSQPRQVPKETEMRMFAGQVKGVRYDIAYPKTAGGIRKLHHIPDEILKNDFSQMAAFGFNTVFFNEEVNGDILTRLHAEGLNAVLTLASPNEHTDYSSQVHLTYFKNTAIQYIRSLGDFKARVMFVVFDSSPWKGHPGSTPVDKFGKTSVQNFLLKLVSDLKMEFPSIPFAGTFTSGSRVMVEPFSSLDACMVEIPHAVPGGYSDAFMTDLSDMVRKVSLLLNKPVFISGFGCSTLWPGLNQAAILRDGIEKVSRSAYMGFFIDEWADNWSRSGFKEHLDHEPLEHMGLVTGYRRPKPGADLLQEYLRTIQTN